MRDIKKNMHLWQKKAEPMSAPFRFCRPALSREKMRAGAVNTWYFCGLVKSVISTRTMLCNQKRYCTGKPRYHNGFGVFSCPNFQVQTKRYFSLLRGLELPTPTISGGFWEMYSPESRLFSFSLKNCLKWSFDLLQKPFGNRCKRLILLPDKI